LLDPLFELLNRKERELLLVIAFKISIRTFCHPAGYPQTLPKILEH